MARDGAGKSIVVIEGNWLLRRPKAQTNILRALLFRDPLLLESHALLCNETITPGVERAKIDG